MIHFLLFFNNFPPTKNLEFQEKNSINEHEAFESNSIEKIEKMIFNEYFGGEVSVYDTLLTKRLAIYQLILQIPNDQQNQKTLNKNKSQRFSSAALNELFPTQNTQSNPDNSTNQSHSILICTLVFIPLIKSISLADPSVYIPSLNSLETILLQTKPLSLRSESPIVYDALRDFLESLVLEPNQIDDSTRQKVFNLLIKLASATGSLSSLLSIIKVSLNQHNSSLFPLTEIEKVFFFFFFFFFI